MKSTKKLIISIAALVIALAVSVSSTFAWFTINSTPEVGDFELKVTAGEGLYIMNADGAYVSTIETADVLALLKAQVAEEEVLEKKIESLMTEETIGEIAAEKDRLIKEKEDKLIAAFELTNTGTDEEKAEALANYKKDVLPEEIKPYKNGDLITELAVFKKDLFKSEIADFKTDTTDEGFGKKLASFKLEQAFIDLTLADFLMRDVTSVNGKAFTAEKGGAVKANDYNNTVGSFISLKLTFRSESKLYVGLSEDSSVTAVGGGADLRKLYAWKDITLSDYSADTTITDQGQPTAGTIKKGEALPATRAANAARLSFVNDNAAVKVWDPNSGKGYTNNTKNMANDYRDALLGNETATTVGTMATADIALLDATTAADANNSLALLTKATGEAYYGGTVTVNIWLEGWDADCFNSILKDIFATKLIFKGSLKV